MKAIYIIFYLPFLTTPSAIWCQNLIEFALENEYKIIEKEPLNIDPYISDMFSLLEFRYNKKLLNEIKSVGLDTTDIIKLIRQINTNVIDNDWIVNEIPDGLILKKGEKISKQSVKAILQNLPKDKHTKFKKDVRSYNNDLPEWRELPLKISKPILNNNKDLAILGYKYGNDGGKIVLFKEENKKWIKVTELVRWNY